MSESKIGDIVSSLLSGVHGISKSETIVGEPQQAGDATIIPVHRLKIAFGAGSATAGGRSGKVGGKSGGHGAGGAVELDPVAVIAIGKNGNAHLLTVEGDESTAWSSLLRDVPDVLARLAQSVGEKVKNELNARAVSAASPTELSAEREPAPSALPERKGE
ncbi:MAG: spore germination protein GerW family protein [Myxococcales bacterium]